MLYGKYQITADERERRRKGFRYATATMVLEGADYTNSPDNPLYEAWIEGNLTFAELREQVHEISNVRQILSE